MRMKKMEKGRKDEGGWGGGGEARMKEGGVGGKI